MFDVQREELIWGDRKLVLETGKTARQADGAVVATYGETTVLATVVAAKEPKAGIDFMPLTVNYQERAYAAGRIPGGYFKREGRPSEKETLVSRLIDRPIRPLFVEGWRNDTQVVVTVLSHDLENDPDIVSMVAASAALTLSGVPFMGPIGAARVGYLNGGYKLNPLVTEVAESTLDLVVAGTQDAVLMVESEAKELSEDVMLGAVMFGHKHFQPVIEAIIRLAEKAAKEPRDFSPPENADVEKAVLDICESELRDAYKITVKQDRYKAVDAVKAKVVAALCPAEGEQKFSPEKVKAAFKEAQSKVVRWNILDTGSRIDGRDVKTVRPIVSEVGVLPRAHGSSLFTRGETQALVVATLGTGEDEQFIDALEGTYKERFLLHYNFPPYSVGETGRMGSPGRREIGHGKLAWRAIRPVLPPAHEFPYTIRVVSEITESNGSSSMASVCGGSLSLMDAGVPLRRPVAGIAMGLILEGERFAVLSDILGDEDHLGDMDFKVAGTDEGITSLQMDIKIAGITEEIMRVALAQAKDGRAHILGEMAQALTAARPELGEYAPRIETMQIPTDKIRDVIGTGGKIIREIVEKTGAKINIEDTGVVKIASSDGKAIKAAYNWIRSIVAEPEAGTIYDGTIVKIMEFGAFVNFFGAKDGLVHISELAPQRVAKVGDVVKEGQKVKVKFLGADERGKIRLSMKVVDQETGEDITEKLKAERAERGEPEREERSDRGDRGDRGPRRDRGERRRESSGE
ncbi:MULTISPECIES: polyribonucleotide nucleotidyltransferase [Methylorubrum]|jgi:polyribonucleotide nucleotidyltransferase|uniref:Polyribonucleotide nucleotidyltransferase n=3 Tax=Methylorubrum TaxID=2282523 RepID=PNP_METPB|nr:MULTISPECIES: polyribonucleotide nucleotidyltransferase [Methylorubrum]B1ZGS7.1 RecName: Full=Polyribonucleotide nucleotidyltransferase; AltName: Full=Polynucleotide phosphorylase; Short=PNPase [Methylorubrum populi BJ001]ACB82605.1 Polyribonucleotide nucleotidyltransferase [Methylorubrum populi BJ001]KAB7783098.1 Polyribonucleotide nucleotidyltransferase [Methylorubrum populi]MBA8913581.1 polyribonucleotide nucleotidyltransferase [Methylorubrum thiocyanatum]OAH32904.1 polyribonucleotide nu